MANQLSLSIEGQVIDSVSNQVLDTISRLAISLTQPGDSIDRQTLLADNVTEADLVFPATITLPAIMLVVNRDATNALLIGPKVAGVLARFVEIPPGLPALFPLDPTTILRYKSLVAPVLFYARAWSI